MDKKTNFVLGTAIILVIIAVLVVGSDFKTLPPPTAPVPQSTDAIIISDSPTPWPIPTGGQPEIGPTEYVPPDPGHGPIPVCQIHPGQGLSPGATCPSRRQ